MKKINKKSSAGRKKSSVGRKKSSVGRKKSSVGRKKSSVGRKKSSVGRKKSSVGRKKSPYTQVLPYVQPVRKPYLTPYVQPVRKPYLTPYVQPVHQPYLPPPYVQPVRQPYLPPPQLSNPNAYFFLPKPTIGNCGAIFGGIEKLNCMELPLRDIKYIIGPCMFYFFKCGSRNIYLFGEMHSALDRTPITSDMNKSNTIFFPGFVYSLVKQNPTINYDLMFEAPNFFEKGQDKYAKRRSQTYTSSSPTINSIYNTFYDCINPDNRASLCMYKNLRTHYIDYRDTVEGSKIMAMPSGPEQSAEIRKLVATGKVAKQIAAIKDDLIRTVVGEYATQAIYEEQIDPESLNSVTVLMDIYGIARMLREFDSTTYKHNSQFKGTPQNIIYYAGAYHIDNMRKFFTNYLGLTEGSIKAEEGEKCESFLKLDVESLQDMVRTMPDTVPNP
jgi:hypothetical protein